MEINRRIKYEKELDDSFWRWIVSTPGGENVEQCIQCGMCSGSCPLSIYMDYTPRRLIAMIKAGFKDEVLKSFTIWLCSSCYTCTVQCPMNIKVTDLMYILKQKAIEDKKYPKRFPISVLSKEFFDMVSKKGRNTESNLVFKLLLKTNPLKFFGMASLGLNLIKTGRMNFKSDSIKNIKQLKTILNSIKE